MPILAACVTYWTVLLRPTRARGWIRFVDVGIRVLLAAPLRGSSAATLRIGGECGRSVGGGCFVRSAEQILGLRVGLGSLQDGASLVVLGASVRTRGAGVCLVLCLPL